MSRSIDPTSDRQVQQRATRMRTEWREQVLRHLAGGVLQAAQWRAWELRGNTPGPHDSIASWPRLPDLPGEEVQLGVVKLDLNTPEGWAAAKEAIERAQWSSKIWVDFVMPVTQRLSNYLEHSHLLGADFYRRYSAMAGQLLQNRTVPVTTLGGGFQTIWRCPEQPLGLPPRDHPFADTRPDQEERVALDQVSWHAARELYRVLGNAAPDEDGRRGLERPEVLQIWCERLGLSAPDNHPAAGPVGDKATHRAATALPWSKAQSTMLSPRLAEHGDRPGQLHKSRDGKKWDALVSVAGHSSAISASPMAWAHLQRAQGLLASNGPEMARMSLLFSMLASTRDDPTRAFVVEGDDLLKDFGLDGRTSGGRGRTAILERSKRLRRQAEVAQALDLIAVQCKDYLGPADKDGNRPVRWFTGRLWQVDILEMGTERQNTLGLPEVPEEEKVVTRLRLLVRPGAWIGLYPPRSDAGGSLWYGHMATAVLKLSHERNTLAAVLGIYLSSALYDRKASHNGETEMKVGRILDAVLPPEELEQAKIDRDYARHLRNRWVAALEILNCRVGFRFDFCPDTYPTWAIPERMRPETAQDVPGRAPNDALTKLRAARLTIRWPQEVLDAAGATKAAAGRQEQVAEIAAATTPEPARRKREKTLPTTQEPNGALLRQAREAAGLSQRAAAALLKTTQASLSRYESGQVPLPLNKLDQFLDKLKQAATKARYERAARA